MLLPALAMLKNAWTIPSTVPRNPIIGAPPEMVARVVRPFSSLAISTLPMFSTAAWMSESGRPILSMPFSTSLATGESYFSHRAIADLILPS